MATVVNEVIPQHVIAIPVPVNPGVGIEHQGAQAPVTISGGTTSGHWKALEAARRAAESARAEAAKKTEARRIAAAAARVVAEQARIRNLKSEIEHRGGSTRVINTRDATTGNEIRITTTKKGRGGERVFNVEDLKTGKVTTRTFEKPKGGGGATQSGGLSRFVDEKDTSKTIDVNKVLNIKPSIIDKFVGKSQAAKPKSSFLSVVNKKLEFALSPAGVKYASDEAAELFFKGGKILGSGLESALKTIGINTEKVPGFGTATTKANLKSEKGEIFVQSESFFIKQSEPSGQATGIIRKPTPFESEDVSLKPAAKELLSNILLFSAFSPAIKTGTSQQVTTQTSSKSGYVWDNIKKKFIKKSSAKDVIDSLREPKVDVSGKTIKISELTFNDKAMRIREWLSKASTQEQKNAVIKAAKEAFGDDFVKKFASQEFGFVSKSSVASEQFVSKITPVNLEQIGFVGGSATAFDASKVGETNFITSSGIFADTKQDTKQTQAFDFDTKQDTKQTQGFATATDQTTKQDSITGQTTISITTQATDSSFSQPPITITAGGGGYDFVGPKPPQVPKTPKPIPKILLFSGGLKPRRAKSTPTTSKKGFIPQVKSKGKWETITKKPRTKREALALAHHIVDNSTAVQLRLIEAKKKAIKETTKRRINTDKYRDYSFRGSKKTKLPSHGLIEKKKFRIDSPGEKSGLSVAKALKSKGFTSLTSRKRKKTKPKGFF